MMLIMNKFLLRIARLGIVPVIFLLCNGCGFDSDEFQDTIYSNAVCTDWGASKSEVMDYMYDYEMSIMDNGFICYVGRNSVKTISYQLQDGKLQASLILIPQDNASLSELQSSFGKYEYLGEKSGVDIYVNEKTNTMATIARKSKSGTAYYAIGYTALDLAEDAD